MNTSTKKEQNAVSAAASVSVPKPPNKPTIMITGNINSHLASQSAAPASRGEKGSRTTLCFNPIRIPTAATQPTITSSGKIAPMNNLSPATCDNTQYNIPRPLLV